MITFRKALVAGTFAASAVAAFAGPASAAVTVGNSSTVPTNYCGKETVYWMDHATWTVPSAGVMTSVTHYADIVGTPKSYSIKLMRNSPLRIVAATPQLTHSNTGFQTSPVRIPVTGGEFLGMYGDSHYCGTVNPILSIKTIDIDPEPGLGNLPGVVGSMSGAIALSATIEADVDGDGFGDETQDGCPANPARQAAPCVAVPAATCKVPSLAKKTVTAAKKALAKAGCKLGKTKKKKLKKFTKTQKRNRVRTQTVKAGTIVPAGTTVSVKINAKD